MAWEIGQGRGGEEKGGEWKRDEGITASKWGGGFGGVGVKDEEGTLGERVFLNPPYLSLRGVNLN